MKKLLAAALILFLIIPCAFAESVDLSGMSFDELSELQARIAAEIVKRQEWNSTTIPVGIWRIGEDIPAGTYCIESAKGTPANIGVWGYERYDYETNGGLIYNYLLWRKGDIIGKIELKEGYLMENTSSIIISPEKIIEF